MATAVAAVAVWAGASATTAAAIGTAVVAGAVVGAVVGAGTVLSKGGDLGDVLKGAVLGATTGAVTGTITGGLGSYLSAGTSGVGTGTVTAGEAGLEAGGVSGSVSPATASALESAGSTEAIMTAGANTTGQSLSAGASNAAAQGGMLGGAANWITQNPTQAMLLGQGVGGTAKSMTDARASEKEIDALMERDRLNRESLKISGLDSIQLKTVLPTISGFMERPKWQMPDTGLIWGGMQNAETTAK